jgi:hypothetical protein
MSLEKYRRSVLFSRFQSIYRIYFVITFINVLSLIRFFSSDKIIANQKIELNPSSDTTCVGRKQSYGSRNFLTLHPSFDRESEL